MRKLENYQHTIYASYLGYVTQAIVNNFAPLLFLTFSREFSLTLDKITLITSLNFAIQLVVDLLSARFIDRIGYRKSVAAAHFFAFLGHVCSAGSGRRSWLLRRACNGRVSRRSSRRKPPYRPAGCRDLPRADCGQHACRQKSIVFYLFIVGGLIYESDQ